MMRRCGNLLTHGVTHVASATADAVKDAGTPLLITVDIHGYVWVNVDHGALLLDEAIGVYGIGDGTLSLARRLCEEFREAMATRAFRPPPRGRPLGRKDSSPRRKGVPA
jgi:hypothetical protein